MTTKDLLISDFSDSVFRGMFKRYFAELNVPVKNWDGLFEEMNTHDGGNLAYVRFCGDEPAGFIQFKPVTLENWFFKERLGFIREFWVDKKFRKHGQGTALLSLTERYFKDSGIHRIILTADESEQPFYLNRGYRIVKTIEAKNEMTVLVKDWKEAAV